MWDCLKVGGKTNLLGRDPPRERPDSRPSPRSKARFYLAPPTLTQFRTKQARAAKNAPVRSPARGQNHSRPAFNTYPGNWFLVNTLSNASLRTLVWEQFPPPGTVPTRNEGSAQ
jgi:hypothetical protein